MKRIDDNPKNTKEITISRTKFNFLTTKSPTLSRSHSHYLPYDQVGHKHHQHPHPPHLQKEHHDPQGGHVQDGHPSSAPDEEQRPWDLPRGGDHRHPPGSWTWSWFLSWSLFQQLDILRGIHSDLHNVGQEINQLLGFQVIDIFNIMMMVVICDGHANDHYFDENWMEQYC